MKGKVLESTGLTDELSAKVTKNQNIIESGLQVHGFVTIIKNKGKTNEEIIIEDNPNLLTVDGRDAFHQALYIDTSATQVGFNHIAVSSNVGGADASHTALADEITTGGLARKLATTRTHTDDTNESTLAATFTASAIHADVQLSGLFDQLTIGGTLSHENTFTVADLEIGDTLTVTWTLTLG